MDYVHSATEYASQGPVLAAVALCVAAAPIGAGRSLVKAWWTECYGAAVMIACTFSPGKWWGVAGTVVAPATHPALAAIDSVVPLDWVLHWFGVAVADRSCGGPHVNPGVSWTMCCIGKIPYAQFVTHVAGQMLGGVVAFPALQALAAHLGWTPLGGPAISPDIAGADLQRAVAHEFAATLLLCLGIFAIALEAPFKDVYVAKISCIAGLIRTLIVYLGAAGPAMNPMLATTWVLYETGSFPTFYAHYLVYWAAPLAAATLAAAIYALLKPGATCLGVVLRPGVPAPKGGKKSKKQ